MSSPVPASDVPWPERALRELLGEWESVRLRVTGECMAPWLRHGDVVWLQSARRRRPRWGDVVLVRTPAGLRLHRLIWGFGGAWRTKGDRAPFWDARVPADDILAVAPKRRHAAAALRSLVHALVAGTIARVRRAVRP